MTDDPLKDFVRAALNLGDAARYVIDGKTFGHSELMAALTEFFIADRAMTEAGHYGASDRRASSLSGAAAKAKA